MKTSSRSILWKDLLTELNLQRKKNAQIKAAVNYVIDCYADGDDAELHDAMVKLRTLATTEDGK